MSWMRNAYRRVAAPIICALAITLVFFIVPASANDTFASAETLSPALSGSLTGTNTGATVQTSEPKPANSGTATVWYNWTAPASGVVNFATCNIGGDSTTNFDTMMTVYTGAAVNALTSIVTNDDGGTACAETGNPGQSYASIVSFTATSGTVYHIQIVGYSTTVPTGNFTLNWGMVSQEALVTAVTTGSATEGGATAAYTVVLSTVPSAAVTVTVPAPATYCTRSPTTLTFTNANWNVPQTITVTATNDTIVNGTRTCGATALTSKNGTYTATVAAPTITVYDNDYSIVVTKISNGGVGTFAFSGSNGFTNKNVTTAIVGTGVSSAAQVLTTTGAATTLTETITAGYVLASVNCTGLGSGGTFTPNLSTGVVTLDDLATAGGSAITCTFTNAKTTLPNVTLTKISNGGVGSFSFSGTNGFADQIIVTTTSGTGVAAAKQYLTTASTATTLTEAIPSDYVLASITCTGLGGGGTATPNLAAGSVALNAAATATGSAIACTFTNGKIPTIALQKALGGTGRLFAADQFTLTASGSGAPASVTTTGTGTAITTSGISFNATSGSAYSLSEAMAPGSTSAIADYIQSAACTNAYGGGTSVSGLTTVPINFNAAYGDVVSCIITNAPGTPNLTITKTYAPASTFSVGQNVTYTYVISNTGNVPLHNVSVHDMHGSPATLVALGAGGITNETLSTAGPLGASASQPDATPNDGIWSTLAPGAAVTFTWAHTVTQAEIDHG